MHGLLKTSLSQRTLGFDQREVNKWAWNELVCCNNPSESDDRCHWFHPESCVRKQKESLMTNKALF